MSTQRPTTSDSTASLERSNSQQDGPRHKGVSLARFEKQTESPSRESPTEQVTTACDHHWRPPFMPWFEQDFQGSLRVRQLDRVARWIYGDLLRAGWHCDSAPFLPNDEDQLRAICDCPPGLWKKHRQAVIRCFIPTADGKLLFHPKVVREYERALSEHRRKVAAGKSRWNRPMIEGSSPQVHHTHEHMHLHQHVNQPAPAVPPSGIRLDKSVRNDK